MPVMIHNDGGTLVPYTNAEMIPAFLLIPEELLRKTNQKMYMLPRTRRELIGNPDVIERVKSDNFLNVIIDAYAYMAWPHMGLAGRLEDYSGYAPCWRVAHCAPLWIYELTDMGILYSIQDWLQLTENLPDQLFGFAPYDKIDAFMKAAVTRVMKRDGYAETLRYAQMHPCWEDFDARLSWQKLDFYNQWYAENEEKTANAEWSQVDYQSMRDVMDYAMNDAKTEKQYYVSGWNCSPDMAREEMQIMKQQYGKEDGILTFHGYQSFKPGEVTPEIAHEIGVKLAKELWSDHQVIVATHLDKAHIHNHFVVNSVSMSGRKFNATKASYRQMREASDRLCREYALWLSVYELEPLSPSREFLNGSCRYNMPGILEGTERL